MTMTRAPSTSARPVLAVLLLLLSMSMSMSMSALAGPSLAVLPLRADGLQLNEANRLNLLLRARAGTRGGYDVQSADLTVQLVEAAQSLGIDCDVNATACGVELGRIADVAFVLLGRATSVTDEGIGLDLTLVDVALGVATRHIHGLVPSDPDAQIAAIDVVADHLFGTAPTSSVGITVSPADATITVDGVAVDVAAGPVTGLVPGRHVVTASAKRFLAQTVAVTAEPGVLPPLVFSLQPDPDAEVEVIGDDVIVVPFVAAGVGAVVAVAGAVMVVVGVQPALAHQDATNRLAALDQTDPGYPSLARVAHEDSATAAADWSSYGAPLTVGGVVAAGIGVIAAVAGVAWGMVLLEGPAEGDETASSPTP